MPSYGQVNLGRKDGRILRRVLQDTPSGGPLVEVVPGPVARPGQVSWRTLPQFRFRHMHCTRPLDRHPDRATILLRPSRRQAARS